MLNPPKEVPIILKLCQYNWDKPIIVEANQREAWEP